MVMVMCNGGMCVCDGVSVMCVYAMLLCWLYSSTSSSAGTPSPVDPYDSYFRVRLICIMLDTCGQYFDRGSSKKRLDSFLVFFQVQSSRTKRVTSSA